jgi:hypothetical protein
MMASLQQSLVWEEMVAQKHSPDNVGKDHSTQEVGRTDRHQLSAKLSSWQFDVLMNEDCQENESHQTMDD